CRRAIAPTSNRAALAARGGQRVQRCLAEEPAPADAAHVEVAGKLEAQADRDTIVEIVIARELEVRIAIVEALMMHRTAPLDDGRQPVAEARRQAEAVVVAANERPIDVDVDIFDRPDQIETRPVLPGVPC